MNSEKDDTEVDHPWMYKPILMLMDWFGERRKRREIEELNEKIHDK
ncbi:hypothetical protein [Natronorubrum halophilum]|nr:hypothetical protein [Natronorubrum halophilum]